MAGGGELERDVGRLLWVGFDGVRAPDELLERIGEGLVGGAILFKRNIAAGDGEAADIGALIELVGALHAAAPRDDAPLLVSVDQEGGRVQRVRAPATVWPPMLSFENVADDRGAAQLAFDVGVALGAELALLGFDIDFAPVLDVHTNPANPVIGDRAFATEPERVAHRALAFARGLASAGVLACGKHFPGHGDTATDSHLALPRVDHDIARLRAVELAPFARAARQGVPLIMTAHVVVSAVDPDVPATLSRAAVTGLLRRELGYTGVIVSDDLDMKAIRDHFGAGEAAVRAVAAGCDALLLCADREAQREAFDALAARARSDVAFRERVREAAGRVRGLAARREPTAAPSGTAEAALTVLGCARHVELARVLAGAGDD